MQMPMAIALLEEFGMIGWISDHQIRIANVGNGNIETDDLALAALAHAAFHSRTIGCRKRRGLNRDPHRQSSAVDNQIRRLRDGSIGNCECS
jgi:hypothetical protein